jgi:Uma2 family endonuclease
MSLATRPATAAAAPPPAAYPARRWTIAELDRMVAAGILREGGPEFLWDGEIRLKMGENIPHNQAFDHLLECLIDRLDRAAFHVRPDHPIVLRDDRKPEPDLVVARGPRSAYRDRQPGPADIALVVEIANTSYLLDATERLRGYAEAGIVQYWIVNIDARRVEVYRNPRIEDGVGVYDAPLVFALDGSVPLELSPAPDAPDRAHPAIPVIEILQDSLGKP